MGFWTLFEVASMPILQVLIIGGLGAFMATGYSNLLPADARRSLNKIVFMIFTPSLMFAYLAKTVTLEQIISWWFMPVNVGLTFLFGGILGWIAVKLLKPEPHLEGLIIACCSAGNLGNLMLIIVPAICNEHRSPFGDHEICRSIGLSYASFSMALGGFFIWTYTFHLVRSTAISYKALQEAANKDFESNEKTQLLDGEKQDTVYVALPPSPEVNDTENQLVHHDVVTKEKKSFWSSAKDFVHQILEELMSPPTIAAILGLVFGAVPWLKGLIIGEAAPFHVIQDCFQLLGNGTIPCITLILGGNLTRGFKTGRLKPGMIMGVVVVRYLLLPIIGAGVVRVASMLGFLPQDPLYHFVLMIQFTLPPAMNIGTMAQLFDMGQEECSVLYLWTYLVAAFALTFWATVYMWILS